jgi:hypothetical protein
LSALGTNWITKRRAGFNAVPVVTLVCLILLALLAVVQVAHVHISDSDADHCPLCIMMHSAAPVAIAAAAVVLVQIGMQAPQVEARVAVRHWHPKLYTRPPPTSLQS